MAAPLPEIPRQPWQRQAGPLQMVVEAVRELQEAPSSEGAPVAPAGEATEYPSMTAKQAIAGNDTRPMVVSPKVLKGLVAKIVEEKLAELTS